MQEKGVQITCDRCGKTDFFKLDVKGNIDSSYIKSDWGRMNGYEPCPECLKGYKAITADYFKACESFIANNK